MPENLLKAKNKILSYGRRFIIFLIILATLLIFLLELPEVRRPLINSAIKVPEYFTVTMVRRAIKATRDFETVNFWLNLELDLADMYSSGNNKLFHGLIDNSRYAIDSIRFHEENEAIRPFIEKLVQSQPDLFLARLWLARIFSTSNPEKAFEQLDRAFRLSSANSETYRTAFDTALKWKDYKKLKKWCDRYLKSQFGGSLLPEHTTPFNGMGLRKLLLEVIDEKGNRQMIPNAGLQLGINREYDFALPRKININTLRLHLSVLAGIEIKIEKIKLFNEGLLNSILQDQLRLTSSKGFHMEDGSVLATNGDGEIINIYSSPGFQGQVDRVVISIRFDRLKLTSPALCKKRQFSEP